MELAKAQKYSVRVSDKYYLTDNQKFLYVKFELVMPDRIFYQAGQYVSIKVNEQGERRSYSIASSSDDNHGFHILAEIIEGGKGSEYLKNVQVGEVVEVMAPLGRFVIQDNKLTSQQTNELSNKLLFVATGSGIVPIYSMINDLLINKHETRQVRLHWGMRSEENLFWIDNFERLMEAYPNFVFDLVLSQPGSEWNMCSGHVQDCLRRDFPLAHSTSSGLQGWEGYVCGSPEMVEEVVVLLSELGIDAEHIYHEKFT